MPPRRLPIERCLVFALAIVFVAAACGPSSSQSSFAWRIETGQATPGPGATVGPVDQGPGLPDFGQPGGQPGAGNLLLLEPWQVTDPMANNEVAMTFLVLSGWQASGNVQWLPEWRRLAQLQTHVTDPNTGLNIEWLPAQDFIWFDPPAGLPPPPIGGNYQGKAYVPPQSDPARFVADFWAPSTLPELQGVAPIRIDHVPPAADEFVRQYGGPATADAFRLRYQFNQGNQPWEEDVYFAWLFAGTQQPIFWFVNFAYVVRAPLGVIDANPGVISTVVSSRTTTPAWEAIYRVVGQLFTQGLQQQIADTAAFGRALEQYRNETQALQQQVVQERQQSQDRIADLRGETLQGIQNLVNPFDNTIIALPADWNTYWVNQQGEYIVSDQTNFDPNQVPQLGSWQRLQQRPTQ